MLNRNIKVCNSNCNTFTFCNEDWMWSCFNGRCVTETKKCGYFLLIYVCHTEICSMCQAQHCLFVEKVILILTVYMRQVLLSPWWKNYDSQNLFGLIFIFSSTCLQCIMVAFTVRIWYMRVTSFSPFYFFPSLPSPINFSLPFAKDLSLCVLLITLPFTL